MSGVQALGQSAAGNWSEAVANHGPDERLRVLLEAVAVGCSQSFALLYEHTHRRVLGIVLRTLRHRGEAEEVLQEIYAKVWMRSAQFDVERGTVFQWLAGIARRAAIDAQRHAACRPSEFTDTWGDDPQYDAFVSPEPGPVDALEKAQAQRWVINRLRELPFDQKQSLMMAFIDEMTHAEIAERLSCPLGTIKSRVRRAMLALRPPLQTLQ